MNKTDARQVLLGEIKSRITGADYPPPPRSWHDLYTVDCRWLVHEIERLEAVLDGDPNQMETPETRRAWRQSAVRYADKLEAEVKELKKKLEEKNRDQ